MEGELSIPWWEANTRQNNAYQFFMPKLLLSNNLISSFRRKGLLAYPKEYMETLWGDISKAGHVKILRMEKLPFDPTNKITNDMIEYNAKDVKFGIEKNGLIQLGTIHTHPWPELKNLTDGTKWLADCSPSEIDWAYLKESPQYVMGIMTILPRKSRRVTRIRFYVGAEPFEVERI